MLTTLADMIVQFGLSWLIQSSLVLLPASAALVAWRRLGPNFESLACRWVLVGLILTPFITVGMQAIGMRGWPASSPSAKSTPTISPSEPLSNLQLAQTNTARSFPTTSLDKPEAEAVQLRTTRVPAEKMQFDLWSGRLCAR